MFWEIKKTHLNKQIFFFFKSDNTYFVNGYKILKRQFFFIRKPLQLQNIKLLHTVSGCALISLGVYSVKTNIKKGKKKNASRIDEKTKIAIIMYCDVWNTCTGNFIK